MKIEVDRNELLEAVTNLSRAVLNRAAIPVLEGILLSAEESKLTLMSYNLEIGMTKIISVRTIENGDIVLNAKIFLEILRKLRGNIVTLTVDEKMIAFHTFPEAGKAFFIELFIFIVQFFISSDNGSGRSNH